MSLEKLILKEAIVISTAIDTDSILVSVKKLLGLTETYEVFDNDIIMYINSAIASLAQLGVKGAEGYTISDDTAKWSESLVTDTRLEFVKTYVYLKVKLLFDPPTLSSVLESYKQMISEYEFRIMVAVEEIKNEKKEEVC